MTGMKAQWAMVLAAGLGTRLRPWTESLPKPLVPVAGRPMIHYPLSWLRAAGIKKVVINLHYLGEMIERELADGRGVGLEIHYSREEELLGAGGGVVQARKFFGKNPLLLINSDTLVDADPEALLHRHYSSQAAATLVVVPFRGADLYTPLFLDEKSFLKSVGGKGSSGIRGEARTVHYAGLAVLEPELIEYLPPAGPSCLVRDGLIPALTKGEKIAAYLHRGYWRALDTQEMVRAAEEDILKGRFRLAEPAGQSSRRSR